MANEVDHIFLCLMTACISPFMKCPFMYIAHFSIGLFVFLLSMDGRYLYIWDKLFGLRFLIYKLGSMIIPTSHNIITRIT